MKKIPIAIAALTLTLAFGCKNQNQSNYASTNPNDSNNSVSAQQTTNLSPEELGELGAKIKKHPSDAQKLLSEKGLTSQQFEQAVRKVAESPEDSKKYAAAYRKAS